MLLLLFLLGLLLELCAVGVASVCVCGYCGGFGVRVVVFSVVAFTVGSFSAVVFEALLLYLSLFCLVRWINALCCLRCVCCSALFCVLLALNFLMGGARTGHRHHIRVIGRRPYV